MSKRFIQPQAISAAEHKFGMYLRNYYRISVTGSPPNLMYYWDFSPRHSKQILKSRYVDYVLEDYRLPVELLGPHHLEDPQETKDERIFKAIEEWFGRKPVLIYYDDKLPSVKKMREWHSQIRKRIKK